jgi:hypothetical protein
MVEVFILEEEVDLGAGAQGVVAAVADTRFCEGRKIWSRALMLMTL